MRPTSVLFLVVALMLVLANLAVVAMYDWAWWESRKGDLPGFAPDAWTGIRLNATVALVLLFSTWATWMVATGRM